MKAVISGAGVAGPTLAWWLTRAGHDVTLIEKAPQFRAGGYVIDFWGVGYDVACYMGLEKSIKDKGYDVGLVRYVDEDGDTSATLRVETFAEQLDGRYTSLARGDLAQTIYDEVKDRVDTRFGDTIARIEQDAGTVSATLATGAVLDCDLLIGADGLHSKTRELVFGPQSQFEVDLGYRVSAFRLKGYSPREPDVYVSHARPGGSISRFAMAGDETLILCVFMADELPRGEPQTNEEIRAALRHVFADMRCEAPHILDRLDEAEDLYYDKVSQIRMPTWSEGRVGLIGDAAACVSLLAGEGTGLAMAEAYVLAGELGCADVTEALACYHARMADFLADKQSSARRTASSFAPKTQLGLVVRNLALKLMKLPFVAHLILGGAVKDKFGLPDYEAAHLTDAKRP